MRHRTQVAFWLIVLCLLAQTSDVGARSTRSPSGWRRTAVATAIAIAAGPLSFAAGEGSRKWSEAHVPPRPLLLGQELRDSCAMASARMVIHSMTGQDVPEAELRRASRRQRNGYRNDGDGTRLETLPVLLRRYGVQSHLREINLGRHRRIARALSRGNPAIVVRDTANRSNRHAVVLDAYHADGRSFLGDIDADWLDRVEVRDPFPKGRGQHLDVPAELFREPMVSKVLVIDRGPFGQRLDRALPANASTVLRVKAWLFDRFGLR